MQNKDLSPGDTVQVGDTRVTVVRLMKAGKVVVRTDTGRHFIAHSVHLLPTSRADRPARSNVG